MSLFLYCSEKGLTWLREGRLPFLEATALMDPFVSNTAVKESDEPITVSDQELSAELKTDYDALPESLSSLMTFEYFKDQALQKRESIETKIRQRSLPQTTSISLKQQMNLTLLCLHKKADNPALWQHLGANHQGMVIELDQSHAFFTAPHYKGASQISRAVKYGSDRPLKLKDTHPMTSLFHRSGHFKSEQEWRVLRPVSVSDKKIQLNDLAVHLHKIPNNIIKSVTFGAAMTETFKETLMSLLNTDIRYRRLPIMECRLDPAQFQLHRVPVERN